LAGSDPEAFVRDVETRAPQYDRSLSEAIGARLGLKDVPSDTVGLQKLLDDIESGRVPTLNTGNNDAARRCAFIASKERNRQLSPLALVGYDPEASKALADKMSFAQLQRLLAATQQAQQRHEVIDDLVEWPTSSIPPSADSCLFMLDVLLQKQHAAPSLEAWHSAA